jgi:hypothetical protein
MFKLWSVTSKGLWVLGKMSIEFGNHVQALVCYIQRSLSSWPNWALSLATMFKLWLVTSKGLRVLGQIEHWVWKTMFKLWSVTSKGLWVLGQNEHWVWQPCSSFGWLLQYKLLGFKKKVQRIHKLYAENWQRIVIYVHTLLPVI